MLNLMRTWPPVPLDFLCLVHAPLRITLLTFFEYSGQTLSNRAASVNVVLALMAPDVLLPGFTNLLKLMHHVLNNRVCVSSLVSLPSTA
jgi:hypothetical protein